MLQRHQLRHILKVRRSDRLTNKDVLQKCHQLTIEAQLRQRRGHWIGHMLRMGNGRLALQLLYSRLPGRKRQGGQFQTLVSLYAADVQSTLDSQQRRHVAEVAAEKDAWNDLFAAKPDFRYTFPDTVPKQSSGLVHALSGQLLFNQSINQPTNQCGVSREPG